MADFPLGLSFNDVLLVPQFSNIYSRREIDLKTKFSKRIKLNIPIVSAAMDTVTESKLAIALAREGGLGVIHRFMSIEDQVNEVKKVKRVESYIIEDPYTISPQASIKEAIYFMKKQKVSGLPVVNDNRRLLGILTRRDIVFEKDLNKKVKEVMTPFKKLITASPSITLKKAQQIFAKHKIEKLPLIDKTKKLVGLITSKDVERLEKFSQASKDKKGRLLVGAAIGVKEEDLERAQKLIKAGADILVIDVANGYSKRVVDFIKILRKKLGDFELGVGNVATAEGLRHLAQAGADMVKIGIGPGSFCTTRIVAGVGIPQISAILECSKEAKKYKIPICADGGIRYSGDIVKALAAGADTVMIGTIFAGCEEAPGFTVIKEGRKYKWAKGMASFASNIQKRGLEKNNNDLRETDTSQITPEGVESLIPFRGSTHEVVNQLIGGLRSGFSYCGAKDINELHKKARFIRITPQGFKESLPTALEIF